MPNSLFTRPYYIYFLILTHGISSGFLSVTLPFFLIQNGFSVAFTASIVAIGTAGSLFRFIWGPLTDSSLSLRRWYWIGVITCSFSLIILTITPFTLEGSTLLIVVVFISQISSNFIVVPVAGFMANRIEHHRKGRAGGYYQAGAMSGLALGGGLGLWIASHYSLWLAGIILGVVSLSSAFVVMLIQDVHHGKSGSIKSEFIHITKDIAQMIKIPVVFFVIILLLSPIGTGAASNLWSSISKDWKVTADTVALVTGTLSGLVGVLGCIIGGYIADKWGVWFGYIGTGVVCALITFLMAVMPMEPYVFTLGVLTYGFCLGLMNAAFTAIILYAVGRKNASTKYALLSSLGNVPVVYTTAFLGWAHDYRDSRFMLIAEAVFGVVFIILMMLILSSLYKRALVPKVVD